MHEHTARFLSTGLAATLVALTFAAQPMPALATTPGETTLSVIEYEFTSPVSVESATTLATAANPTATMWSYSFHNGPVFGEFNPLGGQTSEEFVANYRDTYGVEPAITAVIMVSEVDSGDSPQHSYSSSQQGYVGTQQGSSSTTPEMTFEAHTLVSDGLALSEISPSEEAVAQITSYSPTTNATTTSYAASNLNADPKRSWQPEIVNARTTRTNGHQQFKIQAKWADGHHPRNLPKASEKGLEFSINLFNFAGGKRPACPAGFRENFIAVNRNWTVVQFITPAWKPGHPDVRVYADYNDLTDSCGTNSFTVGIQYADRVAIAHAANAFDVTTVIEAPIGKTKSNVVGGSIDVISNQSCTKESVKSQLTDCMGVFPLWDESQYEPARTILGAHREWRAAPNLCWRSWGYGANLNDTAKVTC